MSNNKTAATSQPVLSAIAQRWSPYVFDPERSVEREKLVSIFEAARWSASSFNEQPWRYLFATRDDSDAFQTLLGCLVDANQAWAKYVPALAIGCAKKTFTKNGKPNRVNEHDLGLANAQLTVQATSLGLHVHMMAGIEISKIRSTCKVPDDFDPVCAVAIGYHGENTDLDESIKQRDEGKRQRKPLGEIIFTDTWDQSYKL